MQLFFRSEKKRKFETIFYFFFTILEWNYFAATKNFNKSFKIVTLDLCSSLKVG